MKIEKSLGYVRSFTPSHSSAGYTLLELAVVCAIISILAAIALPAYGTYINRAKISESLLMTSGVRDSIAKYYFYTGKFPTDNYALGVVKADKLTGKYIESTTIESGVIHVLFKDVNSELAGKYISLRPVIIKGEPTAPIHFNCGYASVDLDTQKVIGENKTNLEEKWLPSSCRE